MGTAADPIASALFGKTRQSILDLLYTHPDESFYVREIIRFAGVGLGAVQRELENLAGAGIIRRTRRGNQVHFSANPACPVFPQLRELLVKTSGIAGVVRSALSPLKSRIDVAFIYGSVARGTPVSESDVDLLAIGSAGFFDVISAIKPAQMRLGREINPSVFPVAEFSNKLAAGDRFLCNVVDGPKIFLIGDEDELRRLGAVRVAASAHVEPPGNPEDAEHGRSPAG